MLSLIVPTINRPEFLKLYIDFLQFQNFDGEILIGDSSTNENFTIFDNYLKSKKLNFDVIHLEKKNKDHFEVIRELVPLIKFDYSMYVCDDDFILYKNILKCVEFLKKNKDYSVAGGVSIGIILNSDRLTKIDFIDELNFYDLLEEKPSLRLKNIANNYSVIAYSISRTDELKKRWFTNSKMTNREITVEIHPCFHMAVEGKVKKIKNIFVFRLLHFKRILDPSLPLDRYLNISYFTTVKESIEIISKIISLKENIDINQSRRLAKISYNDYLRLSLTTKNNKRSIFKYAYRIKRIFIRLYYLICNRDIKFLLIYKYNEKKLFDTFNNLLKKNL